MSAITNHIFSSAREYLPLILTVSAGQAELEQLQEKYGKHVSQTEEYTLLVMRLRDEEIARSNHATALTELADELGISPRIAMHTEDRIHVMILSAALKQLRATGKLEEASRIEENLGHQAAQDFSDKHMAEEIRSGDLGNFLEKFDHTALGDALEFANPSPDSLDDEDIAVLERARVATEAFKTAFKDFLESKN